jgi:hypothetical protein
MKRRRFLSLIALLVVVVGPFLLCAGCGGGANRPATTAVTLTITYKGQPVEGATVTLVPEQGSSTPVATALTDRSGVAKPRTFPEVGGVVPGSYTVTVRKTEAVGSVPEGQSLDDLPPGQGPTFKELLPAKYASPSTSPLKLTVPERGSASEKFDLTD